MPVYSAEALTVAEATNLLRDRYSSVVVLAGDVDAGKTTLLAELYQLFLKGEVGGMAFAGSQTLMGFERRCHLARLTSGAQAPNTERTRQSEEVFLHLLLRDGEASPEQILFADITGEVFERLRISAGEATTLSHVARVDHLAILIPCDRLVDLQRRQKARDDAVDVIRRLLETQLISSTTNLQVIFSKWDYVTKHADAATHQAFIDNCQQKIESDFENAVRELSFVRLDARSEDSTHLVGLLKAWRELHRPASINNPPPERPVGRFFSRVAPESVLEDLP